MGDEERSCGYDIGASSSVTVIEASNLDNSFVLCGTEDSFVVMIKRETKTYHKMFMHERFGCVNSLFLNKCDNMFACCGCNLVQVWYIEPDLKKCVLLIENGKDVHSVAITDDDQKVVYGYDR